MTNIYEVVVDAIEPLLKKDHKLAIKVANAAINAAELGGWVTTNDEHLALMRTIRKRLSDAIADPECPARDLAALTNRMQAVSKEVTMLEEKERQEGRGKTNGSTTAGTADSALDTSQI